MSRHDGLEGRGHGAKVVVATILGHGQEQVLGELVHLQFVASSGQPFGLQGLLHRGIEEELGQTRVLLQLSTERVHVLLHGIQSLILGGGREQGHGIASLRAEHRDGRLHQLSRGRRARGERATQQLRAQVSANTNIQRASINVPRDSKTSPILTCWP